MQQFTVGAKRITINGPGEVTVHGRLPLLEGKVRLIVVALLQQLAQHQQDGQSGSGCGGQTWDR